MGELDNYSAAKLRVTLDKRREAAGKLDREFINRGWGNYRGSDIRGFAKSEPETERGKLSLQWVAAYDALELAQSELEQRKRCHGGEGPIRRTRFI